LDKIIAISAGDVNGIGPEIILKALASDTVHDCSIIIFGNFEAIQFWKSRLGSSVNLHKMLNPDDFRSSSVGVWSKFDDSLPIRIGEIDRIAGLWSIRSIEEAVHWCLSHPPCPLVTAPINKESIHLAGSQFAGHTEMLASLCDVAEEDIMMLLTSELLSVGLVTVHIPLNKVGDSISEERLEQKINIMYESLIKQFGIDRPRLDILGLNPHAGDGGVIGNEEANIISKAIKKQNELGKQIRGPYPADAYFGASKWRESDGVIAMYHDQGLIPFKMLAFESGVNTTLGLPFVRTSPDHGTAFDIAGKNCANERSFIEALRLAKRLSYR
jgi:4-hydroxythreonine-4-phosphate dehydrogenase